MSDDEYPNFGNAWTATSSALPVPDNASWNPALRPDSDAHSNHGSSESTVSNDDFFDRYPGPTPEKRRPQDSSVEHDEPQSPSREHNKTMSQTYAIGQGSGAASSDDSMRVPAIESDAEVPVSRSGSTADTTGDGEALPEHVDDDNEAAIFQPGESAAEQEQELRLKMPETPDPMDTNTPGMDTREPASEKSKNEDEGSRLGSGYEHQGETLEMEEAVDEAPSAPLLDDPEEPPTVETMKQEHSPPPVRAVSQGSMVDFNNFATSAQPLPRANMQPGSIDRSFTTNFTELQTPTEAQTEDQREVAPVQSDGWPSAGDDKTFGELLGDDAEVTHHVGAQTEVESAVQTTDGGWGSADDDTFGAIVGHRNSALVNEEALAQLQLENVADATLGPAQDEDLSAMWASALDDDDLLDDSKGLDPASFFGDDDDGFLEDELATLPEAAPIAKPQADMQTQRSASSYLPASAQQLSQPIPQPNPYAVSSAQAFTSVSRSASTPLTGLYDVYGHGAPQQEQAQLQRPGIQSAQSFADKAKGGYQSPYDLPMEVVKPRQKPRQAQTAPQALSTPPPRSSSMSSHSGPPLQSLPSSAIVPPSSSGSVPTSLSPANATPKASSGFFEDLPVSGSKARARPSGAYTPQLQRTPTLPSAQAQQQLPRGPSAPPAQISHMPAAAPALSGYASLSQPGPMPLLPERSTHQAQPQIPIAPPQQHRYSPNSLPAPIQPQQRFSPVPPAAQALPANSRYSPAPTSQAAAKKYGPAATAATAPPGVQNAHQFLPRTSSPLAHHTEKSQPMLPGEEARSGPPTPASPPKMNGARSASFMSPERTASLSYSPIDTRSSPTGITSPPQRPMTQSPPAVMKVQKYGTTQAAARSNSTSESRPSATIAPSNRLSHRRQFSKDFTFAAPQDERMHDPLERWKGQPIFHWNESGVIVSSLPRHTPYYAAGHGIPSLKCTPGTVSTQQASTFMPLDDRNAKFPGPLTARAKGRKKDVLSWMGGKIEDLERRAESVRMDFQIDPDLKKRTEEKLVLWKIVKIYVEHDGHLEGDKKIEHEVRAVLLPNLAQMSKAMELQSPMSSTTAIQADPIDRAVAFQLRQALLEGDRERAVWLAEEKKLWGHAMLLAATMSPEVWKQIVQSFVRSQVKSLGSDARSLAALYQAFVGNAEECVDELVPPSARAGFRMVSKTDGSISGNPLEGLDQWQETLGLIAGNRTQNDFGSLLALGKLLGGYGRAEAAHTCYLFARQLAKHSGADDAEASFVLLGANNPGSADGAASDLDAIILTEIYEWATSLSSSSTGVQYIPHLQAFKLVHAQELAAYGLTSKAQLYCDHITAAYKSTTRPSPYYHPTFEQAVLDLSAFLSQTPQTANSGLLSKGAVNKVSSGASKWFAKFVAGEDDRESATFGPGAGSQDMVSGPFAAVNGDSSELHRNSSGQDLHNPMTGGAPYGAIPPISSLPFQQFAPTSAPSKYAPAASGHRYAPGSASSAGSSSSFGMTAQSIASPQSRSSLERPSSAYSSRSYAPAPVQALSVPRPEAGRAASDHSVPYASELSKGSSQYPTSQGSYQPSPLLNEETVSYGYQPTAPVPASDETSDTDPFAKPNGQHAHEGSGSDAEDGEKPPPAMTYAPPSAGYEPPSSGGYEPPSYQPYEPDPEDDDEVSTKPKPKRFGDDDDDDDDAILRQADAARKAEADRQADEAFRQAAEADAARDNAPKEEKKGWGLSSMVPKVPFGWGKRNQSQDMPTVHKAKLGEQNSFYFDKELNKWVNKKAGAEAATPAASTPPPPMKGPPSRAVSGVAAMGPPSGPPSRVSSGAALAGMAGPPGARQLPGSRQGSIAGSPSIGPHSGPPSRAGTPALEVGVPMPAAVAALNGSEARPPSAPPSRPSTSMSNASSLDDLLGQPAQRKAGGTVKSKKKGGRYVDVMAK